MVGCRSSGVLTDDALIHKGQCRLVSVHAVLIGASATTVKVFDNTAGSGTELTRLILKPAPDNPAMIEFDMHGVLATNGLYLTVAPNDGAAVSVEFS